MAVTYEDVANTAEALLNEGKSLSQITLRLVRTHLGTGSLGTINPFLSKWKKTHQDKQDETSAVILSSELQNLIGVEINRLLVKSKESSNKRIVDLELQLTELGSQYKALEENHKIATADLKATNEVVRDLRSKHELIQSREREAAEALNKTQIQLAEVKARNTTLAETHDRNTAELHQLRGDNEKLKGSLAQAKQDYAVAKARLEEREIKKGQ